ncbi:MAG TPA: hypothetical protein VH594_13520 [Trebonia sp.]
MVHEELVRPQVMAAIEDLTAREASGILEVTGNPSGALYLDGGRITFGRASWVPGLAARLRAVCPALSGLAEPSPGPDAGDAAIAELAVQRGYMTPAGLHELIRSIVVDAFLVLAIPLETDSPVAAIRFTSTRTDWTEMFPRLNIDLVRGEALRVAERMAEHGLAPTTAVVRCNLRAPAAVLTRDQWAVASQIGDRMTALDLAARRGAALSDTLECLASLARAGLCAPVRVPRQPSSRTRGRALPDGAPSKSARAERLPVRRPAQDHQAWPERSTDAWQGPAPEILHQVLDALRKLS